jgi:hypothetical protein
MPSSLDNPFRASSAPRDPEAEHASVRELLGEEAAAAYRKLQQAGETNPSAPAALTEEEKKAAVSFETPKTKTPEQIRVAWDAFFSEHGIEGCAITLNADGSVDIEGDMIMDDFAHPPIFPTSIRNLSGFLSLDHQESADGLTLPSNIDSDLFLNALTTAKGLTLPFSIGGDLDLSSLTAAKDLVLPSRIGGNLILSSLTSARGLTLPPNIGGDLDLSSLTSSNGLILPHSLGGGLNLCSLTYAQDLILPQSVGFVVGLNSLTPALRTSLRASRPDLAEKILPNP